MPLRCSRGTKSNGERYTFCTGSNEPLPPRRPPRQNQLVKTKQPPPPKKGRGRPKTTDNVEAGDLVNKSVYALNKLKEKVSALASNKSATENERIQAKRKLDQIMSALRQKRKK